MNEKIKNFDDFNESEWNKIIFNLTDILTHFHEFYQILHVFTQI